MQINKILGAFSAATAAPTLRVKEEIMSVENWGL